MAYEPDGAMGPGLGDAEPEPSVGPRWGRARLKGLPQHCPLLWPRRWPFMSWEAVISMEVEACRFSLGRRLRRGGGTWRRTQQFTARLGLLFMTAGGRCKQSLGRHRRLRGFAVTITIFGSVVIVRFAMSTHGPF